MHLRPVLEGISAAHELNLYANEEGVQRMEGGRVVPTFIQTLSVYQAFEYLEKIHDGKTPYGYGSFKAALLILPALAAYRNHLFLHDRIVSISLAAVAVSSVALIHLGQKALGGVSLAVLAIGALARARLLPCSVRSGLDKGAFLITNLPLYLLGGVLKKIYAVVEIGLNLLEMRGNRVEKPKKVEGEIPLDQVEICGYHLLDPEIEPCAAGDLLENFDRINWANYTTLLNEAKNNSAEWQSHLRRGPAPQTSVQSIREGLTRLQGLTFERKLNHIISYLKEAQEDKKAEILVRLGLSAYGYSGAAAWEVDAIYAEAISSKDPLLYALQLKRDEIFNEVVKRYFTAKIAYPILNFPGLKFVERILDDFFDPAKKHNYYLYVNILVPDFNLTHSHGAKTDQLAMSDKIYELILRFYNYKAVREIKERYNKQVIHEIARKKIERDADVVATLVNAGVFRRK